jgi:hypothetical protein
MSCAGTVIKMTRGRPSYWSNSLDAMGCSIYIASLALAMRQSQALYEFGCKVTTRASEL